MVKYRLHNITNFGTEIHDFYTEKALNNYIAIFVDEPYWVENLQTHEEVFKGDINSCYIHKVHGNPDDVSRETPHETELQWLNRHASDRFIFDDTLIKDDEPFTLFDKVMSVIAIISVLIIAGVLGYLFLSAISWIVEFLSSFDWKIFHIL